MVVNENDLRDIKTLASYETVRLHVGIIKLTADERR